MRVMLSSWTGSAIHMLSMQQEMRRPGVSPSPTSSALSDVLSVYKLPLLQVSWNTSTTNWENTSRRSPLIDDRIYIQTCRRFCNYLAKLLGSSAIVQMPEWRSEEDVILTIITKSVYPHIENNVQVNHSSTRHPEKPDSFKATFLPHATISLATHFDSSWSVSSFVNPK